MATASSAALKAAATDRPLAVHRQHRNTIAGLLVDPQIKAQIALALPKHMTADRLARIALTEVRKNPKLAQCDQASFLGAIMQCASLGLEPGGALGHCYLLPFDKRQKVNGQWKTIRTDVQLIIGYRGMIDLARRSGQILSIEARAVYAKDHFVVRLGLDSTIEHEPAWQEADRGPLTFVYAVAKLRDGGVQFDVMSRAEVEKVRARSKAAQNGPWVTDYEAMAQKTVVRRLFKYLPVSVEIQRAVGLDEQAAMGLPQDNPLMIEADPIEPEPQGPDAEPAAIVGTDPGDADEGAPVSVQSIHDALAAATNRAALDEAFASADLIPESERAPLQELWAQRAKEFAR